MQTPAELLGESGPLAGTLDGFVVRPQQQAMAEAVATAIENVDTLICEAGTGTGKTFAYLLPALCSGRRVIVSTGTKNLQDQLYGRDLPVVRRALASGGTAALLKGRANYLCLHRLTQAAATDEFLFDEMRSELSHIQGWSGRTRSGDISELAEVPESARIWPAVTSTVDNCLGGECPRYDECFVVKARRNAAGADLVVINHHLFLADMSLREDGFAELIPSADVVIFDEAHQLPELATQFFGSLVSSRQLQELSRDLLRAQRAEAGDQAELAGAAAVLDAAVERLCLSLAGDEGRLEWGALAARGAVDGVLDALITAVEEMSSLLAQVAERGAQLANCARRAEELALRLRLFRDEEESAAVRWVDCRRRSFSLHRTPVDVAAAFQSRLQQYHCAWIYTSATLAVGDDFSYFRSRLGIMEARELRWESPYNYREQALLYLPEVASRPGAPDYVREVMAVAAPVLEASAGRAFILFTSHRALREARRILEREVAHVLFVQGDAPRAELLERFRRTANAVLLGTASFWEGVDVRGDALSCVIIDKLPFAQPDDPMLQARARRLREQGGNPFIEYQLPEAVLALKQGVGRLLRDESDRGVLVLCDPRILNKSYGRAFLRALPEMATTRDIDRVRAFFAAERAG